VTLFVGQLSELSGNDPPDRQQPAGAVPVPSGVDVLTRVKCGDDGGVVLACRLGWHDLECHPEADIAALGEAGHIGGVFTGDLIVETGVHGICPFVGGSLGPAVVIRAPGTAAVLAGSPQKVHKPFTNSQRGSTVDRAEHQVRGVSPSQSTLANYVGLVDVELVAFRILHRDRKVIQALLLQDSYDRGTLSGESVDLGEDQRLSL
jgi:hypothetical protein